MRCLLHKPPPNPSLAWTKLIGQYSMLNDTSRLVARIASPKSLKRFAVGCLHAVNVACFLHLFKENVGSPCLTEGPSMLPTFETSGDVAIESIVSHRLAPYNLTRGELVSLRSPVKPNRIICKRIIGLPGDVVCVDPTGLKAPSAEHVIVPKGHVWIAGDNMTCSTDSRDYGPVSIGLIRGRITARVFPFNRFQVFTHKGTYIGDSQTT